MTDEQRIKITKLKQEKNAIILAHYYAPAKSSRLPTTPATPFISQKPHGKAMRRSSYSAVCPLWERVRRSSVLTRKF